MAENVKSPGGAGPSHRGVEVATANAMALFGLIIILGSLQVGIGWGAEGPKSGFFPFYLGVFIVAASAINLLQVVMRRDDKAVFAEWAQLRQVMAVVIPTAIYVAVIPWIGIYVASIALIVIFMMWLGKYKLPYSLMIAVVVIAITYLTFEKWFLVPLPKGPIEDVLRL